MKVHHGRSPDLIYPRGNVCEFNIAAPISVESDVAKQRSPMSVVLPVNSDVFLGGDGVDCAQRYVSHNVGIYSAIHVDAVFIEP